MRLLLPLLLLASCRYVGNRAADFLDQFRGAVGAGTTAGVAGRALGVVDTGLMIGVKPRAAALGWRRAGSFSSATWMTVSRSRGIEGSSRRSGTGSRVRI